MTSATRNENRLSDTDRETIRSAQATQVSNWRGWGSNWKASYGDVPTLERIGYHAIGCDERDLRESELDEIRTATLAVLGL